jgi:hypothetical protein
VRPTPDNAARVILALRAFGAPLGGYALLFRRATEDVQTITLRLVDARCAPIAAMHLLDVESTGLPLALDVSPDGKHMLVAFVDAMAGAPSYALKRASSPATRRPRAISPAPTRRTPRTTPATTACSRATASADCGGDAAWYYDDDTKPQKVLLCPQACTAVAAGGSMDITFGCSTVLR